MYDCDNSELDERLLELNNWQIEQQRKLKDFQDAQRKLLDSEHERILNSLKTQTYEQRHSVDELEPSLLLQLPGTESDGDTQSNKSGNPNFIFNFKPDAIKLKDPNINLCGVSQFGQREKSDDLTDNRNDDFEGTEMSKPRKFLKRGEGLARFRMTFDDFKSPPSIYRERKIKTYLNPKAQFSRKSVQSKSVRLGSEGSKKKKPPSNEKKTRQVPVNIYIAENKGKGGNAPRTSSDTKVNRLPQCQKKKETPLFKVPVQQLTLKPAVSSNCFKNPFQSEIFDKGNEKHVEKYRDAEASPEKKTIEKQIKKDEKELRMFEMLEGKIGDGSFSPNSSLVAKFMDESLSSTPSRPTNGEYMNNFAHKYIDSLRALQRQYLTEEQIDRIQECNGESSSNGTPSDPNEKGSNESGNDARNNSSFGSIANREGRVSDDFEKDEELEEEGGGIGSRKSSPDVSDEAEAPKSPESLTASKTILQEYVENFKRLKSEAKGNGSESGDTAASEKSNSPEALEEGVRKPFSDREIAIKLQRKALQDNVKTLLNWEGAPRRKPVARAIKKLKSKGGRGEKSKKNPGAGCEGDDMIIFKSGVLKERLEELEKEIEVFQKETKNLKQLQRECEAEKLRLERERREFERAMEQERKSFEAQMSEDQKKLQREKTAFEKYCKLMKSQPNRKEREEITNLKKELEKVTEGMAAKESRWGAAQARLRNRLKNLEKENSELRSEVERLGKQTAKKVTFENDRNVGTRIIHAINAELGKIKPTQLVKNSGTPKHKYQCMTARVDTNLRKPIRRIKSVPDLKDKAAEKADSEESLQRSASGTEKSEGNLHGVDSKVLFEGNEESEASWSPSRGKPRTPRAAEESRARKSFGKDGAQEVLYDTLFENRDRGDHNFANGTISEIKRRLENLNLLHNAEPFNGDGDRNKKAAESSCEDSADDDQDEDDDDDDDEEEEEEEEEEGEEDEEEEEEKEMKAVKKRDGNQSCVAYVYQTKFDEKGIREKIHEDGRKEIFYPNGNVKKISPDGRIVKMIYYNGDLKETDVTEGSEKYFYAETKTWHTTYKDGLEVLEFPNGQTERRHPDGSTEILFPNGCVRYCDPAGKDEWRFVDGTVIKTDRDGHKVLLLPNGQKEIHTKEYKKREYPNGTIKLLYADGTQETRYASGRVRLKDKDGNLVMDSGGIR